jgi:hypothetical protein
VDTKSPPTASRARNSQSAADDSIIRVEKIAGKWEAIPRALIDDDRLNPDARWLAGWLGSQPPGWEIRAGVLPTLLKVATRPSGHLGREVTQRMLRELRQCGYLVRTRSRTPSGHWCWRSVFRMVPPSPTMDGLAVDGSAVDGSTGDGKGVDLLHTDQVILNQYTLTTTTDAPAADPVAQSEVVVSNEIRYPTCFEGERLAAARVLILNCPPELRQAVLDEVDAIHSARRVRSPIGLLYRLVERANEGQFVPNLSAAKSQRKLPAIDRNVASESPELTRAEGFAAVGNVAQQALARLRQNHR